MLYSALFAIFLKKKKQIKVINPKINFVEEIITVLESKYQIINTPSFFNYFSFFPNKNISSLEQEIKLCLEKLLNKKGNVFFCLIIDEIAQKEIR
jgi:hypothetical protein